jgi:hypothetical protein
MQFQKRRVKKPMKKILFLLAMLLAGALTAPISFADVWLDAVVSFDQPSGSSTAGGPATNALGPNDGAYVSIDIPEILVLGFSDNSALDGTGNDLHVYQVIAGDSNVDIYASPDDITYTYLGRTSGDVTYDLATYGLVYVNFLKFVGLDNGGSSAGFDLDAVEALNSGDHMNPVPIPAALWLFGSGLMGLAGLRRRFKR